MSADDATQRFTGAGGWQESAGYSRAVRRGSAIAVSGTTAHGADDEALFPGDTYRQTAHCLELAIAAVEALGGAAEDIVRTRLLLTPAADWRAASRAHGERFGTIKPANSTYFVAGLIGAEFLVEVEADAVVLR